MKYWFWVLLGAGAAALPAATWAQTGPRASPGLQQPHLRDDEQIMPSQIVPPPPPVKPKTAAAKPKPKPVPVADTDDDPTAPVAVAKPAPPPKPAEPARVVACGGNFAKNSGHLRLAQSYGVHNVDYTEVAGDDGSTLMASVLFPTDPKRRLE